MASKFSKLPIYIFFFLLCYLIGVILPDLLFGDSNVSGSWNYNAIMFLIWVPVEELSTFLPIWIHASTLFEFLIPIFTIPVFYLLINREVTKMPTERSDRNTKYRDLAQRIFWFFLALYLVAMGMRFIGDAINNMINLNPAALDLSPSNPDLALHYAKLVAYFFDETLSHKILYGAFVGAFVSMAFLQYVYEKDEEEPLISTIIILILGVLGGIGFGISLFGGQAAFEFLIVAVIILVSLLIFSYVKLKLNFQKVPMILFTLGFLAAISLTVLIFGIVITGVKPVYPFFPQI